MTIEEKPTRPTDGPGSVDETTRVLGEPPTVVRRGVADPPQASGVAGYNAVVRSSLLTVGAKVDHYEVREVIGAGSMAEVYRARDTRLGRKVALKLVKPGLWRDDANAVERFLTEARLTAKFSHPHIVQVYAVGEHDGTPFLALEYLRGQNLRERIRERGRFTAREAARMGLAVAEALAEANRHGVLHRDLKPSNVLVPPDGRVRVVDFGLAWQTHEPFPVSTRGPHSGAPSSHGAIAVSPSEASSLPSLHAGHGTASEGTPRYMAPEQWAGAELDGAIDVWALGLILYELVSGTHAYAGADMLTLLREITSGGEVPPLPNREELPRPLVDLISACVRKTPLERPAASEVVEHLRSFLRGGTQALDEGESPFRGLLPFTEHHAGSFFGRDEEIGQCVEHLRRHAMLPVVGPSGAGKSSFVRAGVLPRLAEQKRWLVVRMRPGRRPFEVLAEELISRTTSEAPRRSDEQAPDDIDAVPSRIAALATQLKLQPGQLGAELRKRATQTRSRVLLFVDQLEEILTLVDDKNERERFMVALCRAADDPLGPVRLVLTVRDDFVGQLVNSAEVRDALGSMFFLQRPSPSALESTLRKPLAALGYAYDDPELPKAMVAAVDSEPACLPLLQFAAQQLWEARDQVGRLLLREVYVAIGGVEGALAKHADGVLDALSSVETRAARQIFLRLVTSQRTRRVLDRGELLEGLGSESTTVIERLAAARLLTIRLGREAEVPIATVELAHESLIARWTTLRRWLDEGQDELVFLAEASQAAALWEKRGQLVEELWQGEALADARRMVDKLSQVLPERVARFIATAERKQTRRVRFRRLLLAAVVTGLTLVVLVLGIQNQRVEQKHAEAQAQRAEAQAQRAKAQAQRAEAQLEGARAALGQGKLLETRGKLRLALQSADAPSARSLWWQLRDEPLVWTREFGAIVYSVRFSPDGKYVAVGCQDKAVYLFDTQTRAAKVLRGHDDQVFSVAFSPDGKMLASGDWGGQVRIWNVDTAKPQHTLTKHTAYVFGLSFSPDGRLLASGSGDKTVRLWNAETAKLERTLTGHTAGVYGLSFSPDGRLLASASYDKTVRFWDAETAKLERTLTGHTAGVRSVSFSPDGRLLASAGSDGTVRIWDAETAELRHTLTGQGGRSLGFSPDGGLLATSSGKTVLLWDANTATLQHTLTGHTNGVLGLSFGPNGRLLASASGDKTVRLWDLETTKTPPPPSGHTDSVWGVRFSPDGRLLASASGDKTVRLWHTETATLQRTLTGHTKTVQSVSFSPDGRLLASGGQDNSVRLWDTETATLQRTLTGPASRGLSFSPDGRLLASASDDKTVRLWDVESAKLEHTLTGHTAYVRSVSFSPDGRLLASSDQANTVRLWDAESAKPERTLTGHTAPANGLSFSPDGGRLASASDDKTVRLWDTRTGKQQLVLEQPARAYFLDFHPDGTRLGVPSADGVARIWDIERKQVTVELVGHRSEVNYLRFSPDGKWVATSSDDNTVRLWDADTGKPAWRAPLLAPGPPRLFSHQGWRRIDDRGKDDNKPAKTSTDTPPGHASTTKWQAAVEQRARFAEVTRDGKMLCLQSFDEQLELWSIDGDKRLLQQPVSGMVELRAATGGCLVRSADADDGRALFYSPEGGQRLLPTQGTVTGLGVDPGEVGARDAELYVAAGNDVYVFNVGGASLGRYEASAGITTIARIDTKQLAVGFSNGNLELVTASKKTGDPSQFRTVDYSFERTPASPVTRILLGPMDTLIAAFANGTFCLYSWRDGNQLATDRLHGPIEHLLLEPPKLYAASSLGQHLVWDLSALYAERCALLREVWKSVPIVWREGRAVREAPPSDHRCWVADAH